MPHFYATKADLMPVLELVERKQPIKYTRCGTLATNSPEIFLQASDIPALGTAKCESASVGECFLVSSREVTIQPRAIKQNDGKTRFAFDQLYNPETVTLLPGGWWGKDILLYGRVDTVSQRPTAQKLKRQYANALRKHFVRVGAYYVGKEAYRALEAGKRLTLAEQTPTSFDLRIS